MEFNVLKYSEVKSDNVSFRIDAEFYRKAYLQIVRQVEKKQFSHINNICAWVTQGPNPVFCAAGIPCLTGRNINQGEVSYVDTDHVDEEEYLALSRYQLQVGDTLITLKGKGSIGKVGFVTNDRKAIFSRDIGIIRPDNINPGYLNVFFLCKYGGMGELLKLPTIVNYQNLMRLDEESIQMQLERKEFLHFFQRVQ